MQARPGFSLIEVMIAVLVLSFTVTVFAAMYPTAMKMRSKAENTTRATEIAQRKIEQIRAVPYASITYSGLRANSVISSSPTTAPPYSFTTIDSLSGQLPSPTGSINVTTPSTDLKQVAVTVSWQDAVTGSGSVTATTQIANKEVMLR